MKLSRIIQSNNDLHVIVNNLEINLNKYRVTNAVYKGTQLLKFKLARI